MSPADYAAHLLVLRRFKWRVEWAEMDLAQEVLSQGEPFARAVSAEMDDKGHLAKMRKQAALALAYPCDRRSPEYSPQTHRRWLSKAPQMPQEPR